ncbi:hypothetical protein J2X42_000443 [Arthrobacter sp. BE255]|nr:hypothetical protein [Arthrobacter sp. BE255]
MRSWGASQRNWGSIVDIRRRTVVQMAIATLVLTSCSTAAYLEPVQVAASAGARGEAAYRIPPEKPEPKARYQFDCFEVGGARIGTLSSLEEVWASSRYMRIANCEVTYVGGGPHILTPEEETAVHVAIAAGAPSDDRSALFLRILKACIRTDPRELDTRLSELGAPVIKGALAFAPLAPQSVLLERWLQSA